MTTFTVFRLLPERPDPEQYRKQARELLRACRAGDAEAIERFDHWLFKGKPFAPEQVKLNDAQTVIAEEHGCRSWPKFVKMIREKLEERLDPSWFRQARDAIQNGDPDLLRTLLRQHPDRPLSFSMAGGLGRVNLLREMIGDQDPLPAYLEPAVFDPMRSLASAFRYACTNDQLAVVEYLLDLGLDVNVLLQASLPLPANCHRALPGSAACVYWLRTSQP